MTIRALVADDHDAVRLARELRPDVVLMDIRMPGVDGIAATRQLVGDRICEVLVLTGTEGDAAAVARVRRR